MTDDELKELRGILLTTSAFGLKAAMVKWISSVLERRLAAAQAAGPTANYDPKAANVGRREMQRESRRLLSP